MFSHEMVWIRQIIFAVQSRTRRAQSKIVYAVSLFFEPSFRLFLHHTLTGNTKNEQLPSAPVGVLCIVRALRISDGQFPVPDKTFISLVFYLMFRL